MLRVSVKTMAVVLCVAAMLLGCSRDEGDLKIQSNLAAQVDDTKITIDEIDERFEALSDQQKEDFKGGDGRANFVERLIEEELLFKEAVAVGIDEIDEVKENLGRVRRSILVSGYYKHEIVGKVEIPEEEVREYYESRQEEFTTRSLVKAQHILTSDSLKAVALKKRLDAGEKFGDIAVRESEDDLTASKAGNMGYFNPGGYIRGIGYSQVFSDAVEELEVGVISDVIAHERGYSIVRVNEKTPSKVEPLSEVRNRIIKRLRSLKANEAYQKKLSDLKQKYHVENFVQKRLELRQRTPEELWEVAQIEENPQARIKYYRELVDNYPEHKYAAQALFMIGFVWAEEKQDLVEARRTFDELIRKYPDSDVVESAKWMIENLHESHPKFESVEGMMERMKEDKKMKAEGKE
ncbi:MAG: peptidyl-prolyl cis-trans isomerase [bacterium]|nr:MAG: peptidyl-prolyl cis-trans isomerase [bacterium]